MNILMTLSNPFRPDPRVYNEALSLIKAGHNVEILGWDRLGEYPKSEIIDGIKVTRITNTPFMISLPRDILRLRFFWNLAYKIALTKKFDVIHCHDLDTLPIGVKLKKKFGKPLIYDAHEIFGYMLEMDLPRFVVKYFFHKEKKFIKYVDRLIIAEENYESYFRSIGCTKISVILNCKNIVSMRYAEPTTETFTLLYLGTLSDSRFLVELAEVVGDLKGVNLIIGGIGKLYSILKKTCSIYSNIDFIGYVHPNEVIRYTQKSNGVACMINPQYKNNRIASATKQFEAMICGRPIICTKGTKSGDITEQENCGLVINYDKNSLRSAIIKLRDNPELCRELGQNALKAALEKYNWEIMAKRLISLYNSISNSNEATKMEESIL